MPNHDDKSTPGSPLITENLTQPGYFWPALAFNIIIMIVVITDHEPFLQPLSPKDWFHSHCETLKV